MATQIRNLGSSTSSTSSIAVAGGGDGGGGRKGKADLVYKMEDFAENVNGAVMMAREDGGVITVSEDRCVHCLPTSKSNCLFSLPNFEVCSIFYVRECVILERRWCFSWLKWRKCDVLLLHHDIQISARLLSLIDWFGSIGVVFSYAFYLSFFA